MLNTSYSLAATLSVTKLATMNDAFKSFFIPNIIFHENGSEARA